MTHQIKKSIICDPWTFTTGRGQEICEYEYGKEYDYVQKYIGLDCPSKCLLGACAACKHSRYLGDKYSCCLNNGPNGSKKTCDPTLNASNNLCDSTYKDYCKGSKILNDKKCINWRNLRPTAAHETIKSYCLNNLDDIKCQEWCKISGNGICDNAILDYCENNDDPFCSCVNSKLQNPKFGVNPKCLDQDCIRHGYLTQNMKNANCPDIVNCEIQAKLNNSGVNLANFTINQNCGSKSIDNNETSSTDINTTPMPTSLASKLIKPPIIYVLIFIFVVFVALIFIKKMKK